MPTTTLPPVRGSRLPAVPGRASRPRPFPSRARPSPRPAFLDRRLTGGEAGDRDAVRGAADVVHAGRVEEPYRAGVPPVLATDADLQTGMSGSPPLAGEQDELPDPIAVESLERVLHEDAEAFLVDVVRQEPPCVVARQRHGHLREIVGPEGEEIGPASDRAREERRARHLDHRADMVGDLQLL